MSLADIIYIMKNGRIVSSGSPGELYNKPPDIFTAGFLGFPAMNLLKGKISGGEFITEKGARFRIGEQSKTTESQKL